VEAQEATPAATPTTPISVEVMLQDVAGTIVGTAIFTEERPGVVMMTIEVVGPTAGEHGIHVHEAGACDLEGEMPFASAGAHYNPTGTQHGGPPLVMADTATPTTDLATPGVTTGHAGDLGNIVVDAKGRGLLEITTDRFQLADLEDADGSALVIHANLDDLVTDPDGNSGERIVCGVIVSP
jgi:Cu-Zn family superoxide dismutase